MGLELEIDWQEPELAIIQKPKPRKPKSTEQADYFQWLTKQEWELFFSKIIDTRDRALFYVMYLHGMRASEVSILKLRSVKFKPDPNAKYGRIYINRLKRGISATYPMSKIESKLVKEWLNRRTLHLDSDWLFPGMRKFGKLSGISRKRIFSLTKHYMEMTDIPKEKHHPHVFRHTIAAHMCLSNQGLLEIKDWLGHKSLDSTLWYMRVLSAKRDLVAEQIYKVIEG